ncbi:MAG TPA: type II toxin-antitoxin system VapC family toxin [Rhizomicrobium sp.]|nr:type II toxin-antitoxin system VapC family toxin [Rhizomicrobium sp.]
MNYLLDTNVLSEPSRPRPDPRVLNWLDTTPLNTLFISALSLGELTKGIALSLKRDTKRAVVYQHWLISIREQYSGRVLPVDALVAETWGMMASTGSFPVVDALITSTARAHGLVLATRNRRDFQGLGIQVFDPWTD